MEKQEKSNSLSSKVVGRMATAARAIATDSIENRCFILIHQPKEPQNMAERLAAMKR